MNVKVLGFPEFKSGVSSEYLQDDCFHPPDDCFSRDTPFPVHVQRAKRNASLSNVLAKVCTGGSGEGQWVQLVPSPQARAPYPDNRTSLPPNSRLRSARMALQSIDLCATDR